jgi:hypothetical protein
MPTGLPARPLPKTIDWMPPEQAAAIRAMPLGRQIELSFELRELARQSIEANVKSEHPDFTPQPVHAAVSERMTRGRA